MALPRCEMTDCTFPATASVRVRMTQAVVSGPSRMCALCIADARARILKEHQAISLQVTPLAADEGQYDA